MIGMAIAGSILGLFGAGLSIFSGYQRSREEQEEIRAQQEAERAQREAQIQQQRARAEREIGIANTTFNIEKEDAFRKADDIFHQGQRIDMRSDLDETLTGRAFNLAIARSNAADERALLAEQRSKQQFHTSQGAFTASFGVSGVRRGTNSTGLLLEQNKQNAEQDIALMRKERKTHQAVSLMEAVSALEGGMFRIDEGRDAANKAFRDSEQLKADYSDNGRAVNLFNQKIAARRADLEGSIDLTNLAGNFKQQALNRAYDRAEYTFLDGLTQGFQGFSSGWNLGTNIAGFSGKWKGGSGSQGKQGMAKTAGTQVYHNPFELAFLSPHYRF